MRRSGRLPVVRAAIDVVEPLLASAPLLDDIAAGACRSGWIDKSRCDWYHGSWQYLRLVDMVPSPAWHADFYRHALGTALSEHPAARVLISGTADYSIYAHLLAAAGEVAAGPARVTVADWCPTPLHACAWYAQWSGHEIETTAGDVQALPATMGGQVDVICADAFLTRFAIGSLHEVLLAWSQLLTASGSIVTTVRINSAPDSHRDAEAVTRFCSETVARWCRQVEGGRPMPVDEIEVRARRYAQRMRSWPLDSTESVLRLVSRHFAVAYAETVTVANGPEPARYLRLIMKGST